MRYCAQCRLPLDPRKWQDWRCVGCGPLVNPEDEWWLVSDGANYWRGYCGDCRATLLEIEAREYRVRYFALVEELRRIKRELDAAIWEAE